MASEKVNSLYRRVKQRTFEILEPPAEGDIPSKVFDAFIITLILLNVLAIILESFQSIRIKYEWILKGFEIFSVVIFTVEYILRIWTADLKMKEKNPFLSRGRFLLTPMSLVDFFAILPFYLPMIIPMDLRFIRILRLLRILRLFKIQRYSNSLSIIVKVLKDKKEELFVTLFVTTLLILIASTLMYHIENEVQPDKFPDIIQSMWWAVATLTTVGYGDVYPLSGWGRLLSGVIALLGIGLVALPTGIISSGFVEELHQKKNKKKEKTVVCPHCGKKVKVKDE